MRQHWKLVGDEKITGLAKISSIIHKYRSVWPDLSIYI